MVKDDGSGEHRYAHHRRRPAGPAHGRLPPSRAEGSGDAPVGQRPGADAYVVVRDGKELAGPLRLEGSQKEWTDKAGP